VSRLIALATLGVSLAMARSALDDLAAGLDEGRPSFCLPIRLVCMENPHRETDNSDR
jgi:hypothetical protein